MGLLLKIYWIVENNCENRVVDWMWPTEHYSNKTIGTATAAEIATAAADPYMAALRR